MKHTLVALFTVGFSSYAFAKDVCVARFPESVKKTLEILKSDECQTPEAFDDLPTIFRIVGKMSPGDSVCIEKKIEQISSLTTKAAKAAKKAKKSECEKSLAEALQQLDQFIAEAKAVDAEAPAERLPASDSEPVKVEIPVAPGGLQQEGQ